MQILLIFWLTMITEEWQAKSRLCKRKSWVTQDGNVEEHCDCCSDHRCKWQNETAFPKREVQPHCHCSGDRTRHKNEWQNDTAFPKIEVQPHCEWLFLWQDPSQERVTKWHSISQNRSSATLWVTVLVTGPVTRTSDRIFQKKCSATCDNVAMISSQVY